MRIPDVNVLVYAMREDTPYHQAALEWMEEAASGEDPLGWHPLLGASLIRIATNRKVFAVPSTIEQCLEFIDAILAAPSLMLCQEGEGFWTVFSSLLSNYAVTGARVSDVYWAALAIEHQAALCSADRGFEQFKELSWTPLTKA